MGVGYWEVHKWHMHAYKFIVAKHTRGHQLQACSSLALFLKSLLYGHAHIKWGEPYLSHRPHSQLLEWQCIHDQPIKMEGNILAPLEPRYYQTWNRYDSYWGLSQPASLSSGCDKPEKVCILRHKEELSWVKAITNRYNKLVVTCLCGSSGRNRRLFHVG